MINNNKLMALIPSGGKAVRFGGIYKELLPIGAEPNNLMLLNAIKTARDLGATDYCILSNRAKIQTHMDVIQQYVPEYDVKFVTSNNWPELWEAISSTLAWRSNTLLILPDTVVDIDKKEWISQKDDFKLGLFNTTEPERFSVLIDKQLFTKDIKLRTDKVYNAWGLVQWSGAVAEYWSMHNYSHYDIAFQAAINEFNLRRVIINKYWDLGNWEAYKAYIKS